MNLYQRIISLAQVFGGDIKGLTAAQGKLSDLNTSTKNNLVAALNEVLVAATTSEINDASVSTAKTWSSDKISSTLNELVTSAKADILGGIPPEALNTIKEIADALADDKDFAATITHAISNKVSFSEAQSLTDAQKAQARSNIGAIGAAELTAFSDQMESAVTGLDQRLTNTEGDVTKLKSDVTAAQSKLVEHATTLQQQAAAIAATNDKVTKNSDDISVLTSAVAQNKQDGEAAVAGLNTALQTQATQTAALVASTKEDIATNLIGADVDLVAIYNAAKA